jgi:hypothetical protein
MIQLRVWGGRKIVALCDAIYTRGVLISNNPRLDKQVLQELIGSVLVS